MKITILLMIFSLLFSPYIHASKKEIAHSLRCSMLHEYIDIPEEVDTLTSMFAQGMYYGRLRLNSFGFKWKDELEGKRKDHVIAAIGASLHFKSAKFYGFSMDVGVYSSEAKGSLNNVDVGLYKAGKDVLNRHDVMYGGDSNLNTIAEAYIGYKREGSLVKVGRQMFESFLTASNDTKMIPNTFEGISFKSDIFRATNVKMAYMTKQKLRDHENFHSLLAYGDSSTDIYAKYIQNDDSAMHQGLTDTRLNAEGIDARLFVVEMKNKSIDNTTIRMNYTSIPKLISSAMLEVGYVFNIEDWFIMPNFRVMKQFDEGAGTIGGANLKGNTIGYTNLENLDASLYAFKVDLAKENIKLRFGYTVISDEADIVAPWRGFPTAGFTRAMGQYNWTANTKSAMLQLDYEFDDIDEFKLISRYVIQDFDDKKVGVQADSKVFTLDFLKGLGESDIYFKTRFAHVRGDNTTIALDGTVKLDPSYNELRLEINYLF